MGSGLGMLDEAREKQNVLDAIADNAAMGEMYMLDYRQKPDGYLNYTSTEGNGPIVETV